MTLDLPTHGSTSKILKFRLSTEGFILQTTSVGVLGCGVVSAMLGKDTISSRKSGSLWVSFGGVVVSSASVDEVFAKAFFFLEALSSVSEPPVQPRLVGYNIEN